MAKKEWTDTDDQGRFVPKEEKDRVYAWLLDYAVINYWIDDYDSKATRESYLRYMSRFLKRVKLTPDELLSLSTKKIKRFFIEVKQELLKEGKSSTALRYYNVLKSFYDAHEVEIKFRKRDRVKVIPKSRVIEHVPKKNEIYRIVDNAGSLRNRALLLFLYQSGVRNNALQGLKFKHVKDSLYPTIKIPVKLQITSDIDSKIEKTVGRYYTFLQDEGAEALKTYIENRQKLEGKELEDEDLIFISEANFGEDNTQKSVANETVNRVLKAAAESVGIDPSRIWAHLLRKAFRKTLYAAGLDNDLCEAMMGHKIAGIKENYFDRHDIEFIASEYMKANFSREGVGKLNHIEKENKELRAKLEDIEKRLQWAEDFMSESARRRAEEGEEGSQ